MALIKGALSSVYGALFPGQARLNVSFGMRNPAVPRSFASLGAKRGSPEAREVYLPRRETRCCSSLARSCSVQAAHHREEKSLFVRVKWAEKSGSPVLSRGLDSSGVAAGSVSRSPGQDPRQGSPSPPSGVCPLPPGPKPWLSIPTVVCSRGLLSPEPSSQCHGLGCRPHGPAGLSHGHRTPLSPAAHPDTGPGHCCPTCLSLGLCHLPTLMEENPGGTQGPRVCNSWQQTHECHRKGCGTRRAEGPGASLLALLGT